MHRAKPLPEFDHDAVAATVAWADLDDRGAACLSGTSRVRLDACRENDLVCCPINGVNQSCVIPSLSRDLCLSGEHEIPRLRSG